MKNIRSIKLPSSVYPAADYDLIRGLDACHALRIPAMERLIVSERQAVEKLAVSMTPASHPLSITFVRPTIPSTPLSLTQSFLHPRTLLFASAEALKPASPYLLISFKQPMPLLQSTNSLLGPIRHRSPSPTLSVSFGWHQQTSDLTLPFLS